MRLILLGIALVSLNILAANAFDCGLLLKKVSEVKTIQWYSFEEAIEINEKEKKPIFIDVYTDWCGWCTKMDLGTFRDPDVVKFISNNFIAVKLNAEQKEPIVFKEKLYESQKYGNRSYNELAVQLLDSKLSFPSFVVLSKRSVKIGNLVGYQAPGILISKLEKYVGK